MKKSQEFITKSVKHWDSLGSNIIENYFCTTDKLKLQYINKISRKGRLF